MDTNRLKRFAKEARIKLLQQISLKLEYVLGHDSAELRGKEAELKQLQAEINRVGKAQVIDTVAYTWFNRLMALRFMDANGYNIPKTVTPAVGMSIPEILQNAQAGSIDSDLKVDRDRIRELLTGRATSKDTHGEVYRMLLVATCNYWHSAMPYIFEKISDYTELLLPDDLLSNYSIVTDIRDGMTDEDCVEEELIGWLYQFYISDKKDEVFEKLKKNVKITPENIPAATQLFTPHWIVRYMVENTLGKLWMSIRPDSKLRDHMPYYIESPEGNSPAPIPEDLLTTGNSPIPYIRFLDPCLGSGHVLVYAFSLLYKIYEEEGYNTNEIPGLILENNLFGIDIDERAVQLASFALAMKARSYYNRFLRKPVQPRIISLENIREEAIQEAVKLPLKIKGKKVERHKDLSLNLLTQVDNLGSLVNIDLDEVSAIQVTPGIWQNQQKRLIEQATYLSTEYHCVVTNPPYMGIKGMNSVLKDFVERNHTKSKGDLMACFMERCLQFTLKYGKMSMINQHSWMFLSSFQDLRSEFILNIQYESMLHLGARTFPEIGGEVVQNTAFVFGNYKPTNSGVYIRLTEIDNSRIKDIKTIEAILNPECGWYYTTNQLDFKNVPGSPIGYWLSERVIEIFRTFPSLSDFVSPKQGSSTGDNSEFLRLWYEVDHKDIFFSCPSIQACIDSKLKWFPATKGGSYRRWYGNNEYVINWAGNGLEISNHRGSAIRNKDANFSEALTWTGISSSNLGVRYCPVGFVFTISGKPIASLNSEYLHYFLGLLCSNVAVNLLKVMAPTLSFEVGYISNIPAIFDKSKSEIIIDTVKSNIAVSKLDWDLHETSWGFLKNELIELHPYSIKIAFDILKEKWSNIFIKLQQSEEILNSHFMEIYGLQEELTSTVPLEDITLLQEESRIVNSQLDIQFSPILSQLISYAVGCFFARYSLDKPGLILADQGETFQDFVRKIPNASFMPDADNIIPVLDGEYFTDDIVGKFHLWVKVAFDENSLDENLKFIEEKIGMGIRKYFVKDFYVDHIRRYKKRPIYWMFSSPKGYFKALIYMHRYQPDLCSRMLNDYLQPFISKLEANKQHQVNIGLREDISTREKTGAIKEADRIELMLKDCREYAKTLFSVATQRIEIDLDDGVKVNYQKFKEVLVPIKGLEKDEE